jgi:hypothetical protein
MSSVLNKIISSARNQACSLYVQVVVPMSREPLSRVFAKDEEA